MADTQTTRRSTRIAHLRERHWIVLGASLAIIACAFALQIGESGRVALKWFPNDPLPELCGSRVLFGMECPGCGLTRSFVALAAGDVAGSLRYHRLGWLLALAVLWQLPFRGVALWQLRKKNAEQPIQAVTIPDRPANTTITP